MLEIMQRFGFGQRWRDLISVIWSKSTSRVLLNGRTGRPIQRRRGLRQGDPLSPMLFILAMDPLQKALQKATEQGLLRPIGADPIRIRTSLYDDDAALFIRPQMQDLNNLQQILKAFGEATGLQTNISNSELYGINYSVNGTDLAESFQGKLCQFPCKYLGLPLHLGRLKRENEQVLVDKVGAKLQG